MRPGPDPGAVHAGRLAGTALQHEFAGGGVVARLRAGQDVQPQRLPPGGVRLAEGDPVGELLEVGSVEVHLELVAGFGVEARLSVDAR